MICWSLSFYPQPIHNFRRRSTIGLAIDFPTINVLGFVCYGIYTACFLYSPVIRKQYAARNPISPEPTVRFNDFAFAFHAVILSALVYSQFYPQIWGFKVSRFQHVSKPVAGLFWGSIAAIAIMIVIVSTQSPDGGYDASSWAWIDVVSFFFFPFNCYPPSIYTIYLPHLNSCEGELFVFSLQIALTSAGEHPENWKIQLYAISYVKLIITVVKYCPQAWVNYKRKSTVGWSIWQILLDFSGGVLSIAQLLLDSSFQDDWSGVTGNPVKFLLGNVSIIFDVLFIVQHYILYRDKRLRAAAGGSDGGSDVDEEEEEDGADGSQAPLLAAPDDNNDQHLP